MKFARSFREALEREDFPSDWVDLAIPYGKLKKCLKRVQQELQDLSLDPDTVRHLIEPEETSHIVVKYSLDATEPQTLRPRLTLFIDDSREAHTNDSLSPAFQLLLKKISAQKSSIQFASNGSSSGLVASPAEVADTADTKSESAPGLEAQKWDQFEKIEVHLVSDVQFFDILHGDLNDLDALVEKEEKLLTAEVDSLGSMIAPLTQPSRFSRKDLLTWRSIFELYLDAQVFFSTTERNRGARSSQAAVKQLQWFQDEVNHRNLVQQFRMPDSREALNRFFKLNADILRNVQFQEINQIAVAKILKKFDKRTSLRVSKDFPVVVRSETLLAGSVAKDLCAQISSELLSSVPQVTDYLCPICFSIAVLPVRLSCKHVYCIRCIVKMQRRKENHCPLCRADTVMTVSLENIDYNLLKFLKKYFPKESKEKQTSNAIERGIEDFGPGYRHSECSVM